MEKINQILTSFSLSEAESQLYVAALKLGKCGISELAEKAGMGRTAAYFHIKNLIKKNIFQEVRIGKKIAVVPLPPAELAQSLQSSVSDFKSMLPQLEKMTEADNEIPQIEIEESNAAFRKIYDELIHLPHEGLFKVIEDKRGMEAELKLLDDRQWNQFFSQIAERKIMTKAIFTHDMLEKVNKEMGQENLSVVRKRMWNIRSLPESALPIHNLVLLYNGKISFLFPEISLTITIKHKALFSLMDALFETVFSFAESVRDPWRKAV